MKKIAIILTGLVLLVLFSCSEKFLDKVPQGYAFRDQFLNENGINVLLTGAYKVLNGAPIKQGDGYSIGYGFSTCPTNWLTGSAASDDANAGGNPIGDVDRIAQYNISPNNLYLGYRWKVYYEGIERANEVLRVIKLTENVSESILTDFTAQAMFLRAWFHFELIRTFRYIPYITEDIEHPDSVSNDVDAYPLIVADLQYAAANLPMKQDGDGRDVGRCTKYAAMAVLARVYLFMHNYEAAKLQLDSIIASNRYELMANYHDNYRMSTENNKESIFEIQATANDGSGGTNCLYGQAPCGTVASEVGSGWGFHTPTQNLVNAFRVDSNGLPMFDTFNNSNLANDHGLLSSDTFVPTDEFVDPRLDWTVGRRGIPFLDWGIYRGDDWVRVQSTNGTYMTKKFYYYKSEKDIAYDVTLGNGGNANNFRAYRYAHILLWRAEVAVEENDLDYALRLVNMVRNRAKNSEVVMGKCTAYELNKSQDVLKAYTDYNIPAANYKVEPYSSFPDQEYARNAVRWELRLEFATEGHRFYDLVRWGIAAETLNKFIDNDILLNDYMKGAVFVKDRNEYYPIPETQINLQPGILIQNPAYD